MSTKNANNSNCNVATVTSDGNVQLFGQIVITPKEAKALVIRIRALLKNISGTSHAPLARINLSKAMFDSAEDDSVFTVRINTEQELFEINQGLQVKSRSIAATIGALMEFHKHNESLNIILGDEVIRDFAYTRYTGQFAQQIAHLTQEFLKIRCIYDIEKKVMGIFCRKSEADLSVTFKGQLCNSLITKGEVTFDKVDVPDTYLQYPSMLLYTVRKKLPDYKINLRKTKNTFKFTAKPI